MRDDQRLPDHITTIPDALAFWAEKTPDAPALRSTDWRELTHGELHETIDRVSQRLVALGIAREERVALVLPVGLDMCVTLLGIIASAVAMPLNPTSSTFELSRDLERLRPGLVVTGGPPEALTRDVATRLAIPVMTAEEVLAPGETASALGTGRPTTSPQHVAVILHTSGTTALPKRVPRIHGNYSAAARMARDSTRLTPDDVLLLTAGVHHNMGLADFLAALQSGGSCVVTPGFDPRQYPGWLQEHRPTWTVMTPAELNLLLEHAAASGREFVAGPESRLRIIRAEAQAMTPQTLERAERSLRAPVLTGYGMTETGNITKFGPDEQDRREGSCGRSWGIAIRVIDESGRDVVPGTAGEVVVSGPTVFSGYLDDPAANAAAFLSDGWFRTGDQGYLDENGFLYLTSRLSEMINRGGEKIAPLEVDQALASHPAVAAGAVFPVPDARLGEDIVAATVLKPGATATPRELRGWLLDRLSPFKVPRRIWIVEDLPLTPTGKVQRRVLANRFLSEAPLTQPLSAHPQTSPQSPAHRQAHQHTPAPCQPPCDPYRPAPDATRATATPQAVRQPRSDSAPPSPESRPDDVPAPQPASAAGTLQCALH
jgi:acyl-CoA synthetase (AMP-forming)/AMP-acid ligase II